MLLYIFVFAQAMFLVNSDRIEPYCFTYTHDIFGTPDNTLNCLYAPQGGATMTQFLQNLPMSDRKDNRTWSEMAPSLESLHFVRGYGDYVFEQNVFDSLPNLKRLSISPHTSQLPSVYRLKLPPRAFENILKLRELSISTFILEEETFQAIRSAKDSVNVLRLGDNEPAKRLLDVVSEFKNLTMINLCSNNVVHQISLPNIFAKSASTLTHISLTGFYIPKITKQLFEGLSNLSQLTLVACNVTSIDANAFENLTNLTWLDLQYNDELETLPAGVFDKLTKLKMVKLHKRGEIGNLTRNNFTHVENFDRFDLEMDTPSIDRSRCFVGLH